MTLIDASDGSADFTLLVDNFVLSRLLVKVKYALLQDVRIVSRPNAVVTYVK